jgi:hypothetical protein
VLRSVRRTHRGWIRIGRRLVKAAVAGLAALLTAGSAATWRDGSNAVAAHGPAEQWVSGPAWSGPPTPVPPEFFGVTLNSSTGAMPSFRIGAVRLWDGGTRWAQVEPRPGVFDWRTLDRLVAGANRARLPVLFTFGGTPSWASPDGPLGPYPDGSLASPPNRMADWDSFVRAVAVRYRGRISAYELWVLAPSPHYFTGTPAQLAEMARRAAQLIRHADPRATLVCPSMGELWEPASRTFLRRYAAAGGYQHCEVVGVKLHQRDFGDEPETILELTTLLDRTFHSAGVHPRLWSTGTAYRIATAARLSEVEAEDYLVRVFLVGLFARYKRLYFYSWGGTKIPLVREAKAACPPAPHASWRSWSGGWQVRGSGRAATGPRRASLGVALPRRTTAGPHPVEQVAVYVLATMISATTTANACICSSSARSPPWGKPSSGTPSDPARPGRAPTAAARLRLRQLDESDIKDIRCAEASLTPVGTVCCNQS